MMRLLVAVSMVLALVSCGIGQSGCESAVQDASEISAMEDTVSDLDEAIAECGSLAEFEAANALYPDALDGADAALFASNRCGAEPSLADSAICVEIAP